MSALLSNLLDQRRTGTLLKNQHSCLDRLVTSHVFSENLLIAFARSVAEFRVPLTFDWSIVAMISILKSLAMKDTLPNNLAKSAGREGCFYNLCPSGKSNLLIYFT